ncbi:hypothetical protein FRC11_001660 [Ceratobasidium sp. 423]|nr:hypothetical protein FRC11_001660 [Ceratobasidium sp. 423]
MPGYLNSLAVSYGIRFQRLGELDDNQKAIENACLAVLLTPDDDPGLSRQLANLGASHSERFKRLGELDDLEKGIEYKSRVVTLTPNDHPDLLHHLTNLGVSYTDRYRRLGELDDLDKSIEYECRALDLTPSNHPDFSHWLTNLAVSHLERFECLGELDDLEKGIEYLSRTVALTPNNHPDLSFQLANLGVSHTNRFAFLGDLDDLEKAIEYQARALALTPEDHADLSQHLGLPAWLSNLGGCHKARFQHLGEQDDLRKAIEYETRALAVTPDGHPFLPVQHFHRAQTNFLQYQRTNDISHLNNSLNSFRKASQTSTGTPRDKFEHAYHWATLASQHSSLNPIEAYQTTINLLPQFIWLGATTNQRYQDLKTAETLAIEAALVAIRSSNCALALEWLEHARCVVWNQSLMLRSPLDQLQVVDQDLSVRLQRIAKQLHHAASESRESGALASGSLTAEQVAQQHRRLAKEYDELLAQARKLPGFEDLLRPTKVDTLVRAVQNGPIAVINCHKDGCDALLLIPK